MCALALLAVPTAQSAEPQLGRLFHTPSERAALEDARRRNIRAEERAVEATKQPRPPRARVVTVNGVVQRSDGEAYAWVNGKPIDVGTGESRRVRLVPGRPAVLMRSPEQGRSVVVRVGQQADLRTGRVQESYELKRGAPPAGAGLPPVAEVAKPPPAAGPNPQRAEPQPREPERDTADDDEDEDQDGEG